MIGQKLQIYNLVMLPNPFCYYRSLPMNNFCKVKNPTLRSESDSKLIISPFLLSLSFNDDIVLQLTCFIQKVPRKVSVTL